MELYTLYFIDELFLYDCDAFICVSELSWLDGGDGDET